MTDAFNKLIGKRVVLFQSNGFRYEGILTSITDMFLKIEDHAGRTVYLNFNAIVRIYEKTEADKNGYTRTAQC